MVMQSSNDRPVRERKLPVPVGLGRYIVAQDGTYTVEALACPGLGAMRATRPAIVATATREKVTCFINVPPSNMVR
jgi:hypothetical protein